MSWHLAGTLGLPAWVLSVDGPQRLPHSRTALRTWPHAQLEYLHHTSDIEALFNYITLLLACFSKASIGFILNEVLLMLVFKWPDPRGQT